MPKNMPTDPQQPILPYDLHLNIAEFSTLEMLGRLSSVSKEMDEIAAKAFIQRIKPTLEYADIKMDPNILSDSSFAQRKKFYVEKLKEQKERIFEKAVREENLEVIKWTIKLGANLNIIYYSEYRQYAVVDAQDIDIANWEIPIEKTSFKLATPLIVAVERGNITMLRLLLEAGANPNLNMNRYYEMGFHNVNPLAMCNTHYCKKNRYEAAKLLIKFGANLDELGSIHYVPYGRYPLDFAMQSEDNELIRLIFEKGAVGLSLKHIAALKNLSLQGLILDAQKVKNFLDSEPIVRLPARKDEYISNLRVAGATINLPTSTNVSTWRTVRRGQHY